MDLIHGIVVPAMQGAGWAPYSQVDYDRFKRWGLNAVLYDLWWTSDVEKSESAVGVYDETFLAALRAQVDLAKQNGLKVFLCSHVHFKGDGGEGTWSGWSNVARLGAEYVNQNLSDSTGALGRTRFCNYLSMLARRFPDCGIDPWGFPFHGQGELKDANAQMFYDVTQPALIKAIRDAGNTQSVILNPLAQGGRYVTNTQGWKAVLQTGEFQSPYFHTQADPNIYYGTNSHDAYRVFANEEYNTLIEGGNWDYDITTLKAQWKPAVDFSKSHPVMCVELMLMATNEPIDASRLAWLKETLEIMKANRMSWFWFRYTNPQSVGSGSPQNPDGTDNSIGTMLKEYSPIPPSAPSLSAVEVVGFAAVTLVLVLKLLSRRKRRR